MLYIHIPFCKGKCIYCDFYSTGKPDWNKYIKAVSTELSERIDELKADSLSSVYIGGGTPSLMPARTFMQFWEGITGILNSGRKSISDKTEITVEVNPEDVDEERARCWKDCGVNRISMGVQSLVDSELMTLHRRHNAWKAINSFNILKEHFSNISLDIIYGIPGQTKESLTYTLEKMTSLAPQHISAYSLTYEPGTPLSVLREQGRIQEVTEEESIEFGRIVSQFLEKASYERYEISNYALQGFQSRHNSGYWTGNSYLGLGPAASSFDGQTVRRTNTANLKSYLEFYLNPDARTKKQFYEEECLSTEERAIETIFLSLRTRRGLNLKDFERMFGPAKLSDLKTKSMRWIDSDHLRLNEHILSLTSKGIDISDHIILSLI